MTYSQLNYQEEISMKFRELTNIFFYKKMYLKLPLANVCCFLRPECTNTCTMNWQVIFFLFRPHRNPKDPIECDTGCYKLSCRTYCQISYISHTKSQTFNVSCLVLQLSLPNPWKSGIKSGMKMIKILLPSRVCFILEVLQYSSMAWNVFNTEHNV